MSGEYNLSLLQKQTNLDKQKKPGIITWLN